MNDIMKSKLEEIGYITIEISDNKYVYIKDIVLGDRLINIKMYDSIEPNKYYIMVYEERKHNYTMLCSQVCDISEVFDTLEELEFSVVSIFSKKSLSKV